jgi:hypothetical protein
MLAGAGVFLCAPLFAQTVPGDSVTNRSPVAVVRELLAMSPQERKAAIANRPPEIQQRILQKVDQYQLMPPQLCELRLRETELRWYLRPLMDVPPTNRAPLLERIPEPQRDQVKSRLQLWDLLPSGLQTQFENDDTIAGYFAQVSSATPEEKEAILKTIPPERRKELQQGLDRWQAMSQDQRQKAVAGFNQYFTLTADEKEKALSGISDDERQQMEQTLAAYGKLTPTQRAQCIRSFEKFARMSITERQQFLKNAARWEEMTPEERQKWRELVTVAPIMPPMLPPRPPGPQSLSPVGSAPALATN